MIEWTHAYATRHPVVDGDHKQLFASLNELDAAMKRGARRAQIGATSALALEVYLEAAQWLQAHIMKVDCRLRGCSAA